MPQGFAFSVAGGGVEMFNATATPGQTTLAAQITQVAAASRLTSADSVVVPIVGATAVLLPKNPVMGCRVTVANFAATAVPLLVYPSWDDVAGAASGGQIQNGVANAAFSIPQNKTATFWPLPSKAGVATQNGLAGTDWMCVLSA